MELHSFHPHRTQRGLTKRQQEETRGDLTRKNLCSLDLETTSTASYYCSLPTAPRRFYLTPGNRETVMCALIHLNSSYPQSYLVYHKKKKQKKKQKFLFSHKSAASQSEKELTDTGMFG
jgi:hypothetical protein